MQAVVRELIAGSLSAADLVLREYGFSESEAARMVQLFQRHDEETLEKSLQIEGDMDALIDHTRYSREQLASLFQHDREEMAQRG